jgi:hypothetical protein
MQQTKHINNNILTAYIIHNSIQLQNSIAMLQVDLHGGAITDFHLHSNPVNPLSFRFTKDQMPAQNKAGAVYQGHFLCAGRWGEPSPGEINAGLPNHGQPANINWQNYETNNSRVITMDTTAPLEGLHVFRKIEMNVNEAVCHVSEIITNIKTLGRLYQLVQHPTIGAPFLDKETVIQCNATEGFSYMHANDPLSNTVHWPTIALPENEEAFDLRQPQQPFNAVFSFIVNPQDEFGWVTAYSPQQNLIMGYIWPRKQYPWINLWQHFEQGHLQYRGLEFGNTGLHQPFQQIIANNHLQLFGQPTVSWIDAGEKILREYGNFLFQPPEGFLGVEKLLLENNELILVEMQTAKQFKIGNFLFNQHD